jgi:hypothetical protein
MNWYKKSQTNINMWYSLRPKYQEEKVKQSYINQMKQDIQTIQRMEKQLHKIVKANEYWKNLLKTTKIKLEQRKKNIRENPKKHRYPARPDDIMTRLQNRLQYAQGWVEKSDIKLNNAKKELKHFKEQLKIQYDF